MPAQWDVPTPSGHVYKTPTSYPELCTQHVNYGQGWTEAWDDGEMPPPPTWEMLRFAHNEIEDLRFEVARLRERLKYEADALEARSEDLRLSCQP